MSSPHFESTGPPRLWLPHCSLCPRARLCPPLGLSTRAAASSLFRGHPLQESLPEVPGSTLPQMALDSPPAGRSSAAPGPAPPAAAGRGAPAAAGSAAVRRAAAAARGAGGCGPAGTGQARAAAPRPAPSAPLWETDHRGLHLRPGAPRPSGHPALFHREGRRGLE